MLVASPKLILLAPLVLASALRQADGSSAVTDVDKDCSAPNFLKDWVDLGNLKKHATKLGYTEATWDSDVDPLWMGTADWSALNKTMLRSWYKLNITSEVVYEDHFENWLWEEIVESHPEVAAALEEMGWDQPSWDDDAAPSAKDDSVDELSWEELPSFEKDAARTLGYGCFEWSEEEERRRDRTRVLLDASTSSFSPAETSSSVSIGSEVTFYLDSDAAFVSAGGMVYNASSSECEDFSGINNDGVCPAPISRKSACPELDPLIEGFSIRTDDPNVDIFVTEAGAFFPNFGSFFNIITHSVDSFEETTIIDFDEGPTSVRFTYIGFFGVPATIRVFGEDGALLGEALIAVPDLYEGVEVGIIAGKKIGSVELDASVVTFDNFYDAEGLGRLCFEKGCFPADAIVNIQGKGEVTIDQVQLGDYVQTSTGFSKVYAFAYGHNDGKEKHEYIKIETDDTTLEMSPNHILFIGGNSAAPKMAKDVAVGEIVQVALADATSKARYAKITSIETTLKEGQYAPLTEDGTIVVNNVLASSYSIEGAAPEVKLFGITLIDMHQFEQMLFAPLRLLCMFSFDDFCSADFHDEEGTHNWDSVTEHLIDMLTYDAPDLETANFLSPSVTLPFKMFVLFGMITAHLVEKALTISLSTILIGVATLGYTFVSLGYYTTKTTKKAAK